MPFGARKMSEKLEDGYFSDPEELKDQQVKDKNEYSVREYVRKYREDAVQNRLIFLAWWSMQRCPVTKEHQNVNFTKCQDWKRLFKL